MLSLNFTTPSWAVQEVTSVTEARVPQEHQTRTVVVFLAVTVEVMVAGQTGRI